MSVDMEQPEAIDLGTLTYLDVSHALEISEEAAKQWIATVDHGSVRELHNSTWYESIQSFDEIHKVREDIGAPT